MTLEERVLKLERELETYRRVMKVVNGGVSFNVPVYFKKTITVGKAMFMSGNDNPGGRVVAPPGTVYLNLDGGVNSTLWVKEQFLDDSGWANPT